MKNGPEGSDFLYIALGGVILYSAYRLFKTGGLFGDSAVVTAPAPFTTPVSGILKTESFLGDAIVKATPAGILTDGFLDATRYIKDKASSVFSTNKPTWIDPYIPGAPNFSTKQGPIFVDTSGKAPNFSSITGRSVYVPPPSTPTGKPLYSSSSRVTGAPVGTRFSSGAIIKSSGASGKYKLF